MYVNHCFLFYNSIYNLEALHVFAINASNKIIVGMILFMFLQRMHILSYMVMSKPYAKVLKF
jgi:hypothetical protein